MSDHFVVLKHDRVNYIQKEDMGKREGYIDRGVFPLWTFFDFRFFFSSVGRLKKCVSSADSGTAECIATSHAEPGRIPRSRRTRPARTTRDKAPVFMFFAFARAGCGKTRP